jgi:hypothetical protein
MPTATEELLTLERFDRCDRCSAAAMKAFNKGSLELYFCGHHGNKHSAILESQGWTLFAEAREEED